MGFSLNHFKLLLIYFSDRFADDDESQSELDEEVILPKMARVIHANITGKFTFTKTPV